MVTAPSDASAHAATTAKSSCALWMAVTAAAIAASFLLDAPAQSLLTAPDGSPARVAAHILTRVGEWWVVGPIGLAGGLVCVWRGRRDIARKFFAATLTGLATGALGTLIRTLTGRTRPIAPVAQGFYGVMRDGHWIAGQYPFMSFPSGHVSTLAGLAAAAWMADRRAGVLAAIFAAAVAWSRLAQANHHLSDVVAAAALGIWGARLIYPRLSAAIFPRAGN